MTYEELPDDLKAEVDAYVDAEVMKFKAEVVDACVWFFGDEEVGRAYQIWKETVGTEAPTL